MKLNLLVKKHVTTLNLMLIFLAVVVGYYLISILMSIGNADYIIAVIEKKAIISKQQDQAYTLSDRQVYSILHVRADSFLDFIMLDKQIDCNIIQLLLSLLALFQIHRINANWYDKKFSQDLYSMIDTLSIMATVMWLFSGVQEWYQKGVLKEISKDQLVVDGNHVFLYVGIGLLLMSAALKSFAKHGSRLQQEQDLTI
jgi:hypothetical protein